MHKTTKQIWDNVREAVSYRQTNFDVAWRELDAFDRGDQWSISGAMPSWIPKPSTNYIAKVKKFKTGNLILDDYMGELKPLAPENAPQIWMLQRFYEQIFDKLNLKHHITDVIRTSRLLGTGILYVGWDENYIGGTRGHLYQGEILVKPIEPSTFFVDPKAFSLEEALYCGTFIRTTKEHIMMDPSIEDDKKKDFEMNRSLSGSSMGGQNDRGEIYYNRDYGTFQEDVNVKMINKVQSIIGTMATIYQNPQKIVYEGSGIDPRIISKYGNAFGLVFLSKYPDLANAMRNVPVPEIPRALLEYIQFLKNDIEDFTGMSQFAAGTNAGSIQTAGGIESMIQRSLVGDQDEFALFELFLEQVSYAVLLNAMQYYNDERVMRMRTNDPNNDWEYEYIPFKAEEFQDLAWDFSIDIIQKIKNNDQNRRQTMQMLSEWQLQYSPGVPIVTAADIVKAFNPPGRDAILTRIEQEEKNKQFETSAMIVQQVLQGAEAGYSPEMIAEIVFQTLNPQAQGMGDVQKRQQGLPPEME
ncbi:MAG: hypothetical protein EBY39_03335 [Flavobacteriia bacterium]|nr:hypothetical protein [Flavobacteriia bacterium]